MAASAWTTAPARAFDALSDERLARLAARGDQRASNALFARHQPGLTRYCRTILRHGADAEDAAQNALVAAHRAMEGGTVPMRVKPWLYKIAHNEAIELVRSRKPAEELDESQLPLVAGVEEAEDVRRRLGQLMSDLRALTERQREALVLRELCGLDYAEIAQTLGTSDGAAQQTVFEARSALQQFGEGRALDCEGVQRAMSDCDGMRLRTRRVRAHVRGCDPCRAFELALRARRRDLGLLFPSTGAAGGVLAAVGRLFAEPVLGIAGLKGAAVGLAVLAGGGAVAVTSMAREDRTGPRPGVVTAAPASVATGAAEPAATRGSVAGTAGTGRPAAKPAGRREARGRAPSTPRPGVSAAPMDPDAPVSSNGTATAPAAADGSGGSAQSRGNPGNGMGGAGGRGGAGSGQTEPSAPARRPVPEVVTAVGETVEEATGAAGQAVQDTVEETSGPVQDAAGQVTGIAEGIAEGVAGGLTGATGGLLGSDTP